MKNNKYIFILYIVILSINFAYCKPAAKQENDLQELNSDGYSMRYDHCLDKAGAVDPEILNCVELEEGYQKQRMLKYYNTLLSDLENKAQKNQLISMQKKWNIYHESMYKLEYLISLDGGTAANIRLYQTYLERVKKHADYLQDLVWYINNPS